MVALINRYDTPNFISGGDIACVVGHYSYRPIGKKNDNFLTFKQTVSRKFNISREEKKEFDALNSRGKEVIFEKGRQTEFYYTENLRQEHGHEYEIINFNDTKEIFVCEKLKLCAVPDILMIGKNDCKLIEVKSGSPETEKIDRYLYQLALQKYLVESFYDFKVNAELHFVGENKTTIIPLFSTLYATRIAEIEYSIGCFYKQLDAGKVSMYDFKSLMSTLPAYHDNQDNKKIDEVYSDNPEFSANAAIIYQCNQFNEYSKKQAKAKEELTELVKEHFGCRNLAINTDNFVIQVKASKPSIITEDKKQKEIAKAEEDLKKAQTLDVGSVKQSSKLTVTVKPLSLACK
jgi:hypothetical protein